MIEQQFGLGGLPSLPDPNDYQLDLDMSASVPANWIIGTDNKPRISMPPHLNQGSTPMCGGYSGAQLKRYQEKVDKHGVLDLDAAWLYRHSRLRAGLGPATEGTTARAVLATLLHEGIPIRDREGTAVQNRIASYAAIPQSVGAMQRALLQYQGPVLVGIRWPANWSTYSSWHPAGSIAPKPSPASQGGHLTLIAGWRTLARRIQLLLWNSWGDVWAGRGNLWVPGDDLLDLTHDRWKALDA